MLSGVELKTKFVSDIIGEFFVPSYQRGYRWSEAEVTRLLDDIYETEGKRNYCLQPIVVKKVDEKYELIDGQQRLTTIYLIYKYMHEFSGGFIDNPKYSLSYETRDKSREFLETIDIAKKDDNIDFWFMCNAYSAIANWFENKGQKSALTKVNEYFDKVVKVIWYEADLSEDSIRLFTRLNIGKIPLTSAELVKAMFLSRDGGQGFETNEKRQEVSLQWDNIEKELHNDSLWGFLTNDSPFSYQTRIDLVLDLIAEKSKGERDKYFTFYRLREMIESESLDNVWQRVQKTFLLLKDWHSNHELYHKIGYLIACGERTLLELYKASLGKNKDEFKKLLDGYIKQSIKLKDSQNYADLSYENNSDKPKISKLLLLFNVESVRKNGENTQWFSFDKFKFGHKGRVAWSLEHIHAQQSQSLGSREAQKEWLKLHIPSVESVSPQSTKLIAEMESAKCKDKLSEEEFNLIQGKVMELLSTQGNTEYLHSISNLALLNVSDNAALSNSTFDVKRNAIIEMDKEGQYIPFCTKMVFLKYYTPSQETQLHFWGSTDRCAYVGEINKVLKDYLTEPIAKEEE